MEQRATWTDERLDDLADAMRSGFARVDQDIRDLRGEMHQGFASLRSELRAEMHDGHESLRVEIHRGHDSLRAEFSEEFRSLRTVMFTFGGGIILALIGVIGAILARGA